jgi:hypothetical protein
MLTYAANSGNGVATFKGYFKQMSLYSMCFTGTGAGRRNHFGGYSHGLVAEHNPNSSWTLTPAILSGGWDFGDGTNPRVYPAPGTSALHTYYMAVGPNGYAYGAGDRGRSDEGGVVNWYDPADQTAPYTAGYTEDPTGTTLDDWDTRCLIGINSNARLALSLKSRSGGDGQIKVLNFSGGTLSQDYARTPISGAGYVDAGPLVEVSPNVVVGITMHSSGTLWKAYSYNLSTGTLNWTTDLPGDKAFGYSVATESRQVVLGPDGNVYFFMEKGLTSPFWTRLYRINPSTGALSQRSQDLAVNTGRPFLFINNDIYMYADILGKIKRIQDVTP